MKRYLTDLIEGEKATILSCEHIRFLEDGFVEGTPIEIYKKFLESLAFIFVEQLLPQETKSMKKFMLRKLNLKFIVEELKNIFRSSEQSISLL
jgi:hypothetical protein